MLFEAGRGPAFTLSCDVRENATVIRVGGELGFTSAPLLRERLDRFRGPGTTFVIVDLTDVTFCDSVGLSELVSALQRSEAAGTRFVLSGVHGYLARVLTITGLRKTFEIHPSAEDALRHAPAARSDGGRSGSPDPDGTPPPAAPTP
ncbi:STAS domain-containing protein [Streptosporangium sp. NBC_01639]|uniref:STAS domain-containing protein n=1 Tax=unclassified Streptosporangium TaxID=2632669 RepID=UPI002DD91077|nr:STAS domain-containing protein [Streptosporangium sp. NBC_01756]WSC87838.1 STAS domain-containing protein [Streptosporangium sp. NBC_01756]WTD53457.1 STAS domain-containing protein [Streptosporangium sp. NBC_01639]